jgi:hypothetical protein
VTSYPVACQLCGRTADSEAEPPLTWVLDTDGEHRRWTCPECARNHLRAMEAKLEPEWW